MSTWSTQYSFAALVAICTQGIGCSTTSTVMEPAAASGRATRTSLNFKKLEFTGGQMIIEHATWSDGTEAETLAGAIFNTDPPMSAIVFDDVLPANRLQTETPCSNCRHPALPALKRIPDGKIATMRVGLRSTNIFVNLNTLQAGNKHHLPQCSAEEVRAIASIIEDGQTTYFNYGRLVCMFFQQ